MDETKIIYPELSYKIIGVAFKIFNEIGFGMSEKFYQKAFAKELDKEKISYEKEKCIKLNYQDQNIGSYFLDFLIEDKIIVELKVRPRFGYVHIRQVLSYLRSSGYKLAILIYFTRDGVKYRRIINTK
ncbi:MAG TPA: GxxExxY protein [Candidatus Paceibacterota bacterium]|jgi:GxxExxY protein|nr:GxxExxY protein [Candidatus Pacearchaeota archaeon]HRR39319.1 GxxExxY protein [Candidatus Paceibacterota bacterium]